MKLTHYKVESVVGPETNDCCIVSDSIANCVRSHLFYWAAGEMGIAMAELKITLANK